MAAYEDLVRSARTQFLRLNKESSTRFMGVLKRLHSQVISEIGVSENPVLEAQKARLLANLRGYVKDFGQRYSDVLSNQTREAVKIVTDREDATAWAFLRKTPRAAVGVDIAAAFMDVSALPAEQMFNIFLQHGKKLSDRIWDLTRYAEQQIEDVVTQGVLRGQSAVSMSREMEQFLLPQKWGPAWTTRITPAKVYELGGIQYTRGTVSYNALRLARTTINTAHREAHLTRLNMFKSAGLDVARGVKWNLSKQHYRLMPKGDICDEWAMGGPNGDGVYPLEGWEIPIDHPNGMCYTTTVLT